MKDTLIGIDISNSGLRMAQITGETIHMAATRFPENMINEGRITSPDLMSKFIKEMKSEYQFKGKKCAVILPEFSTFFRNLTMPPVTAAQLSLNLPYEFRDYIGEESHAYNYDYAVENMNYDELGNLQSMDLVAAAGLKRVITEYEGVLKKAGLRLVLALPREMALINLIKACLEKGASFDREYALVDIGYYVTRIYIFSGTHIMASRIIDIGCRDIDAEIADMYETNIYLAASYREVNFEHCLDSDECRRVYNTISLEVMKAMNFYRYENQQSEISDVIFSGSGSVIGNLVDDITGMIDFVRGDINILLPGREDDEDIASLCIMALAVATQKGRY